MNSENFYARGFRAMLPVSMGVVPFGIVMGTVASEAGLSFVRSMFMNFWVFAGASQLAAVELMHHQAAIPVVVATGLMINLRFLLYSAALVPVLQNSSLPIRLLSAYWVTDQSYAAMSAHQHEFQNQTQAVHFYLGAATTMCIIWHLSVVAGYIFGNFAPASWGLDYVVPVSFIVLLIPTLKNKKYFLVALFSAALSLLLNSLPLKIGLFLTAILAIALAYILTQKRSLS